MTARVNAHNTVVNIHYDWSPVWRSVQHQRSAIVRARFVLRTVQVSLDMTGLMTVDHLVATRHLVAAWCEGRRRPVSSLGGGQRRGDGDIAADRSHTDAVERARVAAGCPDGVADPRETIT